MKQKTYDRINKNCMSCISEIEFILRFIDEEVKSIKKKSRPVKEDIMFAFDLIKKKLEDIR